MGHSQAEKAENRERILKAAASQIREAGLEAVSVGAIMKAVGLTHGGFYGHFASRSDLLAQALERALVDGEGGARVALSSPAPGRPRGFAGWIKSYLSRAHRDARDRGCAISALVSDVGRADNQSRAVMAEHIEGYIAGVKRALGGEEDEAILAVCAMVGALAIARVIPDSKRSDQVLKAARDKLIAMALGEAAA